MHAVERKPCGKSILYREPAGTLGSDVSYVSWLRTLICYKDVGLLNYDVQQEGRKPFWRGR